MLFRTLVSAAVRDGAFRIIEADGRNTLVGDGSESDLTLRLHDRSLSHRITFMPELRFAEAYMDGRVSIEGGSLRDFIELAARNTVYLDALPIMRLAAAVARRIRQHNPIGKAQRNVAHHYDLKEDLYRLFLDDDLQYSCAYFADAGDDLETAQAAKKRHIAAKLRLDRPGLKTLDIGSGWGGLGLYLASVGGGSVDGVTLSQEQHRVSRARARQAGLAERVRFELQDYRETAGPYDRIVSVGMFEHVGKANYREFFAKLHELLAEDGVCLLHSIGRLYWPGPINPFMRKYIFPGADLPVLSEVFPMVEDSGLLVTDVEILRLHYAETLRCWYERFQVKRQQAAALYDERFCRMWELYLLGCEMAFRYQGLMVFQMQLAKRLDALPLTRDYMIDSERRLAERTLQAAE